MYREKSNIPIVKFLAASIISVIILTSCSSDDDPGINPSVETKLKSVTTYFESQNGFRLADSTSYTYNSLNQPVRKEYYTYDITEDRFDLFSVEDFSYANGKVTRIDKELTATNGYTTVTQYEYTGNKVTHIFLDDDLDTEAIISYPHKDTVEIRYSISNGNSFTYRFTTIDNNVSFEETFDSGKNLASETINEFDNGINPYSLLGFTDILFTNFSKNNKTKTESEYYAIGFPNSVPFAYDYQYNHDNLPLQQIVSFKSYPNGEIVTRMKVLFEYE